jgi:hypothetical protein
MGTIRRPETSLTYQHTLRNIRQRRPQLHRGGILKSLTDQTIIFQKMYTIFPSIERYETFQDALNFSMRGV